MVYGMHWEDSVNLQWPTLFLQWCSLVGEREQLNTFVMQITVYTHNIRGKRDNEVNSNLEKSQIWHIGNITSSGSNANHMSLLLQTRPNMLGIMIASMFHWTFRPIKLPEKWNNVKSKWLNLIRISQCFNNPWWFPSFSEHIGSQHPSALLCQYDSLPLLLFANFSQQWLRDYDCFLCCYFPSHCLSVTCAHSFLCVL